MKSIKHIALLAALLVTAMFLTGCTEEEKATAENNGDALQISVFAN